MALEIVGSVYHVGETEQVTDTFKSRELILLDESNEDYPQYIPFKAVQAATSKLDEIREGDEVKIKFNLRGRKWNDPKNGNDRFFGENQIWTIDITRTTAAEAKPAAKPTAKVAPKNPPKAVAGDVPF